MDKKELCKMFVDQLTKWKINHEVFNDGFHIQIQRIHQFYPTKRSYYNTETGHKCFYPEFKNGNDFLKWLGKMSHDENVERAFTLKFIFKILHDSENLEEAIQTFKNLKK